MDEKKRGRPATGRKAIVKSVCLTEERWIKAEKLGNGKYSTGIAKSLDKAKVKE